MLSDQRTSIRLRHDIKLGLDHIDRSRQHRVRVPQVRRVDYELRLDVLEQKVAPVELVNVALGISGLLKEEVRIRCNGLHSVNLSLTHELAAGFVVSWVPSNDFQGF